MICQPCSVKSDEQVMTELITIHTVFADAKIVGRDFVLMYFFLYHDEDTGYTLRNSWNLRKKQACRAHVNISGF